MQRVRTVIVVDRKGVAVVRYEAVTVVAQSVCRKIVSVR